MDDRQLAPDATIRLWHEIEVVHKGLVLDKQKIGKLFWQLRSLYSERGSTQPGRRLTSGHGTFQFEIKLRGFKPNRVREWICDFEAAEGLRPPAESTASKRKARRSRYTSKVQQSSTSEMDPISNFASMLPFPALKAAYRTALQELHPDHGGSEERTKELIRAWEEVECLHCVVDSNVRECAHVN